MPSRELPRFLADTWWYALSKRLSLEDFVTLAEQRAAQGFTAVQLVVGIPPEVGPLNPNAASEIGAAWDLSGNFNADYLELARERIQHLNQIGLTAIVYGAWGHQIAWLGVEAMIAWWQRIIATLDDLNIIYCLTGESNLWLENPRRLLPDKTTGELTAPFIHTRLYRALTVVKITGLWWRLHPYLRRIYHALKPKVSSHDRVQKWSRVLETVQGLTDKPFIIHTNAGVTSNEVVTRPDLLAAVTTQTGHSQLRRDALWQIPQRVLADNPQAVYINLEPWYEGILNQFGATDQLYAYWASMMAGATAHCYGAHGIWNVGDGEFLGHWGQQTFEQAVALTTPRLLGQSHRMFLERGLGDLQHITIDVAEGELRAIHRKDGHGREAVFYPDAKPIDTLVAGDYFLPLSGDVVVDPPAAGMLVVCPK